MSVILGILRESDYMWIDKHGNFFLGIWVIVVVIALIVYMYSKYKDN